MNSLDFSYFPNPSPASDAAREKLLLDPGFGRVFTDHMVTIDHTADHGWHNAQVKPYGALQLDPSAAVFHYAQEIFEGLKVYRQDNGRLAMFRPLDNSARMNKSAIRLAMPQLPSDVFMESIEQLVRHDAQWVPSSPESSLYIRPFMFATESFLGVRPSSSYLYSVIASPVGSYFPSGVKPVTVWLSTDYVRAVPGGTGEAKCGGNYAASLLAQQQAAALGCDQVVWLDAVEHRWVEEMGGMNIFFVYRDADGGHTLVTPVLNGSLLPGITRDCLLQLAADYGYRAREDHISVQQWRDGVASGDIVETFACGTAAVITPIGTVRSAEGEFMVGDGQPGAITMQLREALLDLQFGRIPDKRGWVHHLS